MEGRREKLKFDIAFIEGVDFTPDTRQQFEATIRKNFCLLSWLVPDYKIRIINEITNPDFPDKKFKIFTNSDRKIAFVLYERRQEECFDYYFEEYDLDDENQDEINKKIQQKWKKDHEKQAQTKAEKEALQKQKQQAYEKSRLDAKQKAQTKAKDFRQRMNKRQQYRQSTSVTFEHEDKVLILRIYAKKVVAQGYTFQEVFGSNGFMFAKSIIDSYDYFNPSCLKIGKSIDAAPQINKNEIEYNFIEPQNRRFYAPEGYHLSLAFQGGGAKGVSYVGVYKAIKQMQERISKESDQKIKIPITSVIGSSAGGILALAISAGISESDLYDLCYMMDTLVEDRLVQRDPRVSGLYRNQEKSADLLNERDALKFFLHNVGLVQTNLFDILEQTLKDPSVQELLYKALNQYNPSLASLLTYEQQQAELQGELVKGWSAACCCCCYSNCCSCGLYPCCQKLPGASCFVEKIKNVKKINIYGLLQAALMTGDAVENILAFALSCFLKNLVESNDEKSEQRKRTLRRIGKEKQLFGLYFSPPNEFFEKELIDKHNQFVQLNKKGEYRLKCKEKFENCDLMKFVKILTMEDYYALTGVEFTVTSVDLHDKILRFFNHKTTPLLPVCKAVQMTGSFPVAFQALSWKSEWGKYYIHYDKTRREIDLTGHQFTDGGLLANFPLKFLDNEKFREKYFSHKNVPSKTLLYGFGLDKRDDFPQDKTSKNANNKFIEIGKQLMYRIISKFLFYTMKCGCKDQIKEPTVPKLFTFVFELVKALQYSDRNLNKQCFSDEIFENIFYQKFLTKLPQKYQEANRQKVRLVGNKFKSEIKDHKAKSLSLMLIDQLTAIYSRFADYERDLNPRVADIQKKYSRRLEWNKLSALQLKFQQSFLVIYPQIMQLYRSKMQQIKKACLNQSIFVTSATYYHEIKLLELLMDIKNQIDRGDEQNKNKNKAILIKAIEQSCQAFINECEDFFDKYLKPDSQKQKGAILNEVLSRKIIYLSHKLTPYSYQIFMKTAATHFKKVPLTIFELQDKWMRQKKNTKQKIKEQILTKKMKIPKGKHQQIQVHVIFQAIYVSHYHFPSIMQAIQEALAEEKLQVNIISCTDYQAIFGVYYAMGWDLKRIKQNFANSDSFFQLNKHINADFDSQNWMKSSIEQARNFMKNQFEKCHNPMEFMQEEYEKNRNDNSLRNNLIDFDDYQRKIEVQYEQFNEAFQRILNYISGSLDQVRKLKYDQRSKRFDQLIGFGKYRKDNQRISARGHRLLKKLIKFTGDFMMIVAELIFNSQSYIVIESKFSRETIIKGLIVNCLTSAFNYKIYIYKLLEDAGFDKHVTLANFYDLAHRKILLNFNCVNTTQQRFSVINRLTRPNMPLWAALMAAASLPYLQGDFESRKEWEIHLNPDLNKERANEVFKNLEGSGNTRGNSYISANFISTLPLQFMTNNRLTTTKFQQGASDLEQKTTKNINIIQLVFAFDNKIDKGNAKDFTNILKDIAQKMNGKRKFINGGDICDQICQLLCCLGCNGQYSKSFGQIAQIVQKLSLLKMLNVRMNSHDNLIMHIYYDKLIKLPLRIDTLDFYRINRDNPIPLEDTIRQAEETVRQFLDSIEVDQKYPGKLHFSNQTDKIQTTIQFSMEKYDILKLEQANKGNDQYKKQQLQYYRIKFISYTKWRDFAHKYVISLSKDCVIWQTITDDYVDILKQELHLREMKIFLRYTFYRNKQKHYTYKLNLSPLQQLAGQERAILRFNNGIIGYQQIKLKRIDDITSTCSYMEKVSIKSILLPKQSIICPQCAQFPLRYVLQSGRKGVCSQCKDQSKLVAMECLNPDHRVPMRFCLQCKLQKFIIYQQSSKQNRLILKSPKYQILSSLDPGKYPAKQSQVQYQFKETVVENSKSAYEQSKCLLCEKQCFRLWCEKVSQSNQETQCYCGLRICEPCTLNVKL